MDASMERITAASLAECRMGSDLAADLNCLHQGVYLLRAGTATVPVMVAIDPGLEAQCIVLAKEALDSLALPDRLRVNIVQRGDGLCLGPVVGVLVNQRVIRGIAEGRAGFRIEQLGQANRKAKCLLYFFSPAGVDWNLRRTTGYRYDYEDDCWRRGLFPLPDVLYDRGGGFPDKERVLARCVRQQLKSIPELTLFNAQHYFSKWDLHVRLSGHPELTPHLPETVHYQSREDLEQMLDKHGCVYVKSFTGSNGIGVMRVAVKNGEYHYDYFRRRMTHGQCPDLDTLEKVIRQFLDGEDAIVQQRVDVLTLGQSSVDIRALVQRDASGQWRLVALPARIGVEGCAITSTRTGSKVCSLDDCLRNLFGFEAREVRKLRHGIMQVVMSAIQVIEAEYGRFGEIGVDLAVDVNGRIWFIEANAKPAKDTIRLWGNHRALRKSFLLPLQYCKFIAAFAAADERHDEARVRTVKVVGR